MVGTKHVVVGSPTFVDSRSNHNKAWGKSIVSELAREALTPILVSVDGSILAAAGLGDRLRDDAVAAVRDLRRSGWRVRVLSGDHPDVVSAVSRCLGIAPEEAMGGITPEAKMAVVSEAAQRQSGSVVMVGDGVNDAAALAAADVGIAVHGGAEASLAAADIYLNRAGLAHITDLVLASRRTISVIHRNLTVSLIYNIAAAALTMSGLINPLLAAIIMPASSLTVVAMSVRSTTFPKRGGRA
jgi:Cu2+-exporting ATPase